ncbi:MAG: ABC transporter ATP-binding protein [Clostridia bacterium]|nr:ABC transporter ATP-binding protein [Clostridia bacterium]
MRLGNKPVLGPVSLSLYSGEVLGIIGPNGAGKTTLLKVIAGIYKPGAGKRTLPKREQTVIGYVPQDIALYESMTARQNLFFWADVYRLPKKAAVKRVEWLLKELKLEDVANEAVYKYSGGMKRRLNLGAALLTTPDVLLLDEPTVGADEESARLIEGLILRAKSLGSSVVFISHHYAEVERLCSKVIRLENGRIVPANP